MQQIYDCLTGEHDLRLVVLAGVICLLSAVTAMSLIGRARDAQRPGHRYGWLVTAAVATGFGIWSTHFIAMLAYQPVLPVGYGVPLTVASAIVAIVVTGLGISIYVLRDRTWAPTLSGAVVGLGIAAMHYVGMAALLVPGWLSFDSGIVASSVVLGVVLGAVAFRVADRWRGGQGMLGAAVVLTLAICSMHFSAMGAVIIVPDPNAVMPAGWMSDEWLAVAVAAATALVTILCLTSTVLDQHLVQRTTDERQRLANLANASTEGIVICVGETIEYSNSAFLEMARTTEPRLAGEPLAAFFDPDTYQQILAAWRAGETSPCERSLRPRTGPEVPVVVSSRRLAGSRGRDRMVLTLRDLSAEKQSQARIEYLAHHDALTGLANRAQFGERLEHDLALGARAEQKLAVLCVDLDQFKSINETFGQSCGDALLKEVAARLARAVRSTDTVARLSGDEFAILQAGGEQPTGARTLAARILNTLDDPFVWGAQTIQISASAGIALYPDDAVDGDVLLQHADTAMRRAKAERGASYRFFEPDMDRAMRARRELESDLREALVKGGLHLEYQPIANAVSGAVVGFEALVRWRHPERGPLPPGAFIELAEESGLVVPLGEWVLNQACADAASWERPLRVAVNLSPVQFERSDLVATVRAALQNTGLSPGRLELEITEGVLLADQARALTVLTQLKRMGIAVSMDDFGTGYSSLSYLQSFPFDKLKIDRSFVSKLHTRDARAIVKAVIGLAHALELPMVAEGVEDAFQLEFLRAERCTEVQGYFIGRPSPQAAFADLLWPRGEQHSA